MKCVKDNKKECYVKVITTEYEEYPACIIKNLTPEEEGFCQNKRLL